MTALQEELERMKAELEKENEEIKPEEPEEISDEEEIEVEEPKEEEKVEEEEKKPELDDAGYARLRREATAEKRRADELEKKIAALESRNVEDIPAQEEVKLPPEMQSIINEHRMTRAEREFMALENKVKQTYPEYGAVAAEYASAMYQSFKIQNPRKSEMELSDMTKRAILVKAGEYLNAGYENPAEEMFHEAKELGYTGKSFQKQETKEVEEKLQPDMKKVAENRKRSSGMAATNGRQEGMMTLGAAAELTSAEWAKLPIADKRRIMYGQ